MREVTVENGRLLGIPCGWPDITVFYNIPYAAPPVGELRWKAPQPAASWEGVRDCARASARCFQPEVAGSFYIREFYPYKEEMSEDCLYLNVWTPAHSEKDKLPVIFWVHGGAFKTGYGHSAHFDGEHFARKGAILVTINYRLNVFGWMVHPELDRESESGTSGNYGLLDQIAALKWVCRNIEAFGGDPKNITIAGQSAGAACVQTLVCSPLAGGLFQKVILQSGGGPSPFPNMEFPDLKTAEAKNGLEALGVSSIAEARALSGDELLKRWLKAAPENRLQETPVRDNYVLPESVKEAIRNGHTPEGPCLIGYTAKEGLAFARNRADLEQVMRGSMKEAADGYLALCPEDGEAFKEYQNSMATELLQGAAESYALLRELQRKGNTYVYCLERNLPGDQKGAFHAADLWYVFQTLMRSWRPWTGEDYMLANACNTWWANFAKYGTPNGPGKNGLPQWTAYSSENPQTMRLAGKCFMYERERNARVLYQMENLIPAGMKEAIRR